MYVYFMVIAGTSCKNNLQFCCNLRLKTIFYYTCITMPHTLVSVRLLVISDGCSVIKVSAMRLTCFAYCIEDVLLMVLVDLITQCIWLYTCSCKTQTCILQTSCRPTTLILKHKFTYTESMIPISCNFHY